MVAVTDPSRLGDALARGELPIELLLVGAVGALVLGLTLTLLWAGVRRWRGRPDQAPDPAPDGPASVAPVPREPMPWPSEDADVYAQSVSPAPPVRATDPVPPDWPAGWPRLAEAERWPAREARTGLATASTAGAEVSRFATSPLPEPDRSTTAVAVPRLPAAPAVGPSSFGRDTSGVASAAPPASRPVTVPVPFQRPASSPVEVLTTSAGSPQASLGTDQTPLVVEFRAERPAGPVGPNLALVAAIGTVATGAAFAVGAVVGGALGATVGAAIGLAFAGGAGAAVGATIVLLRGHRR